MVESDAIRRAEELVDAVLEALIPICTCGNLLGCLSLTTDVPSASTMPTQRAMTADTTRPSRCASLEWRGRPAAAKERETEPPPIGWTPIDSCGNESEDGIGDVRGGCQIAWASFVLAPLATPLWTML